MLFYWFDDRDSKVVSIYIYSVMDRRDRRWDCKDAQMLLQCNNVEDIKV